MNRLAPRGFLVVTLGLLAGSSAAVFGEPAKFDVREFVCPLGGQHFTQDVGYYSLGIIRFVDGSWLGDTRIDVQIPECPGNGLLLIPDFFAESHSGGLTYLTYTPEQLASIPALLKSKEFRGLQRKGRYERAQWFATQLGMPAKVRWELLVRSSWAAVASDERKRLVLRIVEEGPGLIREFDAPEMEKITARWLVINALRESARFDAALAELASVAEEYSAASESDDRQSGGAFEGSLARMRETIEAKDDDRFPIGMSPSKWVAGVCGGERMSPPYGPMTRNAKAACEKRRQESEDRETAWEESRRLLKNPEQLAQLCSSTPESQRSQGLYEACESAQRDRDSKAADDLLLHHASKVAADCEATPQDKRTGPLFFACVSFDLFLQGALAELLADDVPAYKVICGDEDVERPDLAFFASRACSTARDIRRDKEVRKLVADTQTLDAYCARTPERERESLYSSACSQRSLEQIHAANQRKAADQVAQCQVQKTGPLASNPDIDCAVLLANEQRYAERVKLKQSPETNIHHRDSGLHKAALESAQRVIAKAKADKTYPKRKRGDLY